MAKKTRSTGAVQKAWVIFEKHPKVGRAEMLALCTRAGLNENTAKTQYQVWRSSTKAERASRFTWRAGDLKKEGGKKATGASASTTPS